MVAATQLLKQRPVQIALGVIIILAIVYFIGRKAGKNAAINGTWFSNLFGTSKASVTPPAPVNIDGKEPAENIQHVTDAIYQAFQPDLHLGVAYWFSDDEVNEAFAMFNDLSTSGKASVVNDWNRRYFGQDKPGVFTGDWSTLRNELQNYPGSIPQEAQSALGWMQQYSIS